MKARKSFLIAASCLFLGFVAVVEADAGANLVPTMISGPARAFMNQTISVTYRVKNDGNETSDAYEVRLYLSKGDYFKPPYGHPLKEVSFTEGLAPGEVRKTTTKVVVPSYDLNERHGYYLFHAVVGERKKISKEPVYIARYNDNGDGTVTDHKTGLMWQQDDNGTVRTWGEAKNYCKRLVLGGHNDWLLPPIDALAAIVDYLSDYSPMIDSVFNCYKNGYWSGSYDYVFGPSVGRWNVNFDIGKVFTLDKTMWLHTRCVRYAP